MKKVSKIIALTLSVLLSLGAFACQGGNNSDSPAGGASNSVSDNISDSSSDSGSTDSETPVDENAQLFNAVKEAYQASASHTGGFTQQTVETYAYQSSDEGEEEASLETYNEKKTVNSATKEIASISRNGNDEIDYSYKQFEADGQYYDYAMYAGAEEYYGALHESEVADNVANYDFSSFKKDMAGNLFEVESYAQLQAAFETCIPLLLENNETSSNAENSSYVFEVTGDYELTVEKAEDGAVTLTLKLWEHEHSVSDAKERTWKTEHNRFITAKDGKITGFKSYYQEAREWKDLSTGSISQSCTTETQEATFVYEFDQELFDSVQVSGYENAEYESVQKEMNFHADGLILNKSVWYDNQTVTELYNALLERFQADGTNVHTLLGETWYLDEEKTQVFDPSQTTMDEFFAITDLYGTLTIPDGFAVAQKEYITDCDAISDMMRLLAVEDLPQTTSEYSSAYVYELTEQPTITLKRESQYYDGEAGEAKVYVDGELKEYGSEYPLENQQICHIVFYQEFNTDSLTLSLLGLIQTGD